MPMFHQGVRDNAWRRGRYCGYGRFARSFKDTRWVLGVDGRKDRASAAASAGAMTDS